MELLEISNQVDTVARFITSPTFIWFWCTLVGLYSLRWLFQIYWESLKINGQIKTMNKGLDQLKSKEDFAEQFDQFRKKIMTLDSLKRPFVSFEQSIYRPQKFHAAESAKNNQEIEQNADQKISYDAIQCHQYPEVFFNSESIIQPQIDLRFYNAIPSHLTGLGILGTFCGLAAGIFLARNGLTGGHVDQVQYALGQLLSGASLAFWTSIFGILCSLSFSKFEKIVFKKMNSHIDDFSFNMLQKIDYISIEQILNQQVNISRTQTTYLANLSSQVHHIKEAQGEIETKALEKIIEIFNKNLTEKVGEELKHIVLAFKNIHGALQATEKNLKTASDQFSEKSSAAGMAFFKEISKASLNFRDMQTDTAKEIRKDLTDLSSEIKKSVQETSDMTKKALHDPIQSYFKDLNSLNEKTGSLFEQWDKIATANQKQMNQLSHAHTELNTVLKPITESTKAIIETYKSSGEVLEKSNMLNQTIAQSISNIESIQVKQKNQWDQYIGRFEGVDIHLKNAIQTTQNGLEDYTIRVKEFTSHLDQHMSKGILTLASAVGDLHQVVGHIPDAIKDANQ